MSDDNELEQTEVEATEGETTEAEIDLATGLEVEQESVTEEPAYTPNLTYSVKDEERAFDERLKDVVKSADDEEYFRDLYTRADGLPVYKEKLSAKEQEYEDLYGHTETLTQSLNLLKTLRDEGNLGELFHRLGVGEEALIDHALKLAQEQQLPEDQRQALVQNREMERKLQAMESKISHFETEKANSRIDNELSELRGLLVSEDYRPVAEALQGRGISMAELVVQQGMYMTKTTGKEPSIKEVVDHVAKQYGQLVVQPEPTEQIINNEPAVAKPTLKTVKSTGPSAPVDEPINSIEQLRKLAEARLA
jgi:hypothetical protein